ncbi:MAG TPA: multidrug transporter MatE [Lachnospiraceae bacterium]|nr:multidrug transporter MatE [Lachnospiraceae bacterium]
MHIQKEFFKYVLPSMLAFALSGVYSIADGFFVGNALGDQALAAINIAYPLTAVILSAGTGIGLGGAVQYAICLGTGNTQKKDQYFGLSSLLLAITGILLTFLILMTAPYVLVLFGASGEILALAEEYIRFIAYGAVFQVMGTGMVPFIRNMGGAMASMYAMVAGFMTNIILDYLLVWKLPYGMAGAAAASFIGQGVTFWVCLIYLLQKKQKLLLPMRSECFLMLKRILTVGISPFGLAFSPNLTLILINKSAVVSGGNFAVTCYATVSYISCVVMLLLQGISDGAQPLISLSYGKGDEKTAKQFRNLSYLFSAAVSAICILLLLLCRSRIAGLFGASEAVTAEVSKILPLFTVGFLLVSFTRSTTAYFYATEKNAAAYLLIYGESLCLLILLLILPVLLGIWGTWISVPASQLCVLLLSIVLLRWPLTARTASISR